MSHTPPSSQAHQKALHHSIASVAPSKARHRIRGVSIHERAHWGVKVETCDVAASSPNHRGTFPVVSSPSSFLSKCGSRSDAASNLLPSGNINAHESSRLSADAGSRHLGSNTPVSLGKRRTTSTDGGIADDSVESECSPHPLKKSRRDHSEEEIETDVQMEDSMPKTRAHTSGATGAIIPRPPSAIPSRQSQWQSPHTSPLGPKTSKYVRRSRSGHFPMEPSKATPNPVVKCLLHEFFNDNKNRDPFEEHPQWCDDLFVSGLQRYLHPRYKCSHRYHPCDPEYYEDQWHSDIDISDDEDDDDDDFDCLPTPQDVEDDAKMHVAIHSIEEYRPQSDTINMDRVMYPWSKWYETASTAQDMPSPWDMDEIDAADVAIPMAIST